MKNSKPKPLISFIIPNYNGKQFLKACLNSIYKEKNNLYEVILVDDGSEYDDVSYIRNNFSNLKNFKLVAQKKHLGPVRTFNAGIPHSKGKYIFCLNNDTIIKSGFSKSIINFFESHKKAAVAQAKILRMNTNLYDYAGDFISPTGFLVERSRGAEDKGQFDNIEKVFSVRGTAMIMRRDVYVRLGGFDDDYTFGWEEPDYTWRTWLAGYETYFLPSVKVHHYYGTKKKPLSYYISSQIFYHGCRGQITTIIKNLGWQRMLYMLPISIGSWSLLSLSFLIKGDYGKSGALVKGMWWSLLNIFNTLNKRTEIQKMRKISDRQIFSMVGKNQNLSYYIGKGLAYVRGLPF